MKKNIIVLLALAISLGAMAKKPTINTHTWDAVNADPFTCEAPEIHTLQSTAQNFTKRVNVSSRDGVLETNVVRPHIGVNEYYVFVGHAGNPETEIPYGDIYWDVNMIDYADFIVDYVDVYTIYVTPPVVEHFDTIYVDVASKKADFELYTTAGKTSKDGKAYCKEGDSKYHYNIFKGTTLEKQYAQNTDMPYSLKLAEGEYDYYVTMGKQQINAPARENTYIPEPQSWGINIEWIDLFHIKVIDECRDLVYRKWNDLMFVNNGPINNGGNGKFVAYQWYKVEVEEGVKKGILIEGATEQWYQDEKLKNDNHKYYCKVTDKDGKVIYTCPQVFSALDYSATKDPHKTTEKVAARKIMRDGQFLVERDGQLYTITGERVE